MAGGLTWVALAMALLGFVRLDTDPWLIRLLMFMIGIGMAYIFLPNQAASFATISRADTGQASTLFSVQRQVGSAFGVAALSGVLAAVGSRGGGGLPGPSLEAYRAAFLAAAALAIIGALIALRVPDRDAAATMRPKGEPELAAAATAD